MFIYKTFMDLVSILDPKLRRNFFLLLIFFIFSSLVQIAGVASIAPVITVISNPNLIQENHVLSLLYNFCQQKNTNSFVVIICIISLFSIVIANGMSALTLWLLFRFSISAGAAIQENLFEKTLLSKYIFHKINNYNHSISLIANEAPRMIYMVLQPSLIVISQGITAVFIIVGLLFADPTVAIFTAIILCGSYVITYATIKRSLRNHGNIISLRFNTMQRLLSEALIGIKEVKIYSQERGVLNKFDEINHRGLASQAYVTLAGDIPKFVIETISFSTLLLVIINIIIQTGDTSSVIGTISLYALAGYKLLPTLQQIYKAASSISANGKVVQQIKHRLSVSRPELIALDSASSEKISALKVIDLCYAYPAQASNALEKVSSEFKKGSVNTIVGHSGSGKSTLADILLGLLDADSGKIYLNNADCSSHYSAHLVGKVGYVPQNIFLLDDSVAANIAFTQNGENISIDRLNEAVNNSNASEFVNKLPNGLDTSLGQDGKLLSGGQRQRLGIARALYQNPEILILDEPTSALDIESEYQLMKLLSKLKSEILIIIISHRTTAIKMSDHITMMDGGEVIMSGPYAAIYDQCAAFRELMDKGID